VPTRDNELTSLLESIRRSRPTEERISETLSLQR
jgi:hypothetical protein